MPPTDDPDRSNFSLLADVVYGGGLATDCLDDGRQEGAEGVTDLAGGRAVGKGQFIAGDQDPHARTRSYRNRVVAARGGQAEQGGAIRVPGGARDAPAAASSPARRMCLEE